MPFQFHYGTIESNRALNTLSMSAYFNSTMVRLRERIAKAIKDVEFNFNSTMVRLRGSVLLRRCRHPRISIPLWYDWEYIDELYDLAVNAISIPLWYDWEEIKDKETGEIRYFNSTMVRLRGREQLRLKKIKAISIPLWYDWELTYSLYLTELVDFNSTMVRLRDPKTAEEIIEQSNFNSTMVRLRERIWEVYRWPRIHFNSTMVRLRVFFKCLV